MPLGEQQAIHTLRAHRTDGQTISRQRTGTSSGIHPEERSLLTDERRPINRQPVSDDDAAYETRLPNSARRSVSAPTTTPPRTIMRVTKHQGPPSVQRASRMQAPAPYEQLEQTPVQKGRHLHGLFYVGLALVCMVIGWIALSSFSQWWQGQQDTWHYGTPRTFQVDTNVRHGGTSHFTVENLNGHIVIAEVVPTDLSKMHLYLGPVFSGAGSDLQPATISFEDINGDGYPDMLIAVGTGRYPLINDHSGFRPVNSSDHISGKGV